MGAERPDDLERVAGAVSDGTPVDWKSEQAATPELSHELFHLSQLEKIGEVHGGVVSPDAPTQSTSAEETSNTGALEPALPVSWDRLRVLAKVGQGTGGIVYRAFDPQLQMEVALKLRRRDPSWSNKTASTLVDEGRRLARVRHPNVLVVHGAAESEGWIGIWTEFVRGRSLEEYMGQAGLLGAREASGIGLDLCRALAAVHAAGLVHRDVKPSNVMREDGGRIILADFGSTGEIPSPDESVGGFRGTPLFMAPEQVRNESAGPTADIYGLGVLLYRIVSGRYPIEAKSIHELEAKHRAGESVPLRDYRPDLPLDFVTVVERAIAPDPKNRFRSAAEMERALAAILGVVPPTPPPPPSIVKRVATFAIIAAAVSIVVWHPWIKKDDSQDTTNSEEITPVPPEPIVPVPLTATVSLLRRSHGQTVPLSADGGRVNPGDGMAMEVRGNEAMHVYVLDDDHEGNLFVLFPIPGVSPGNPLPEGSLHLLPGRLKDKPIFWQVTSPAQKERIITIASREPLDSLDRVIQEIPPAKLGHPIQYQKIKESTLQGILRGIGGLVEVPQSQEENQNLVDQAIQSLNQRAKDKGDVWVWEANLQNQTR